jgi:hypothetical protein
MRECDLPSSAAIDYFANRRMVEGAAAGRAHYDGAREVFQGCWNPSEPQACQWFAGHSVNNTTVQDTLRHSQSMNS